MVDPPGSDQAKDNKGYAIAVDPNDGSIYVASAFSATSTKSEFCVTKYNRYGSVVGGWGSNTNGTTTIIFDSGKDVPSALDLDTLDNVLLVAGNCATGWCVARLDLGRNGILDTTFGSMGTESGFQSAGKCLSVSHETDSGHSGYVIMSGNTGSSGFGLVVRLTATGALDSQHFGTTGKVTVFNSGYASSSANYLEEAMFAQSGNPNADDIIVAGQAFRSGLGAADFMLAGLNSSNGSLDTNFGTSGLTVVNFGCSANSHPIHGCCGAIGPSIDSAYSLVCYQQGSVSAPWVIYGVGVTNFSGHGNEFALDRYLQNGQLDTSFQYNGLMVSYTGVAGTSSLSTAYAGGLQGPSPSDPSDKILAAGEGTVNGSGDLIVARYNLDGSLDTTFGSSGSISTDLAKTTGTGTYNTGYDTALGVDWDSVQGTIVVGGWSAPTSTSNGNIALAEYIDNQITINSGGFAIAGPAAALPDASASSSSISGILATDLSGGPPRRHRRAFLELPAKG